LRWRLGECDSRDVRNVAAGIGPTTAGVFGCRARLTAHDFL